MKRAESHKSILPPSYSIPVLGLITLSIIYAKNEADLYIKWWVVFIPLYIFFGLSLISAGCSIFLLDTSSAKHSPYFIRIEIISESSKVILNTLILAFIFFSADYLETPEREAKNLRETASILYIIALISLLIYAGYAFLVKVFIAQEKLAFPNASEQEEEELNVFSEAGKVFVGLLSNTIPVCSGGACSSIYVSTITTFFSAFGISIVDWIPYIRFSALILIFISLLSLYTAKKEVLYWPFLVCFAGSMMILINMFFYEHYVLLILGNVLMVAAAYANSRLNKGKLGRRNKPLPV